MQRRGAAHPRAALSCAEITALRPGASRVLGLGAWNRAQPLSVLLLRVKTAVARKEENVSSLRKQYEVSEGGLRWAAPALLLQPFPGHSSPSPRALAGGGAESRPPGGPPGAAAPAAAGSQITPGALGGHPPPGFYFLFLFFYTSAMLSFLLRFTSKSCAAFYSRFCLICGRGHGGQREASVLLAPLAFFFNLFFTDAFVHPLRGGVGAGAAFAHGPGS